MFFSPWYQRCRARFIASKLENDRVQGEATIESLKRYRRLAFFLVPLHAALAWFFAHFTPPEFRPELAQWAHDLAYAQGLACVGVLVTVLAGHMFLERNTRATAGAIALQIFIAAAYLSFGAYITLLDLEYNAGAGLASFLLICVTFGVLALMRPAISVPVFSLSYVVFAVLLENAFINSSQLASLRIVAFITPALALMASIMNWNQYAKAVVLRRQLSKSNADLVAQQAELAFLADHDALTGLYNRREFMRLAHMELLRATRVPCHTAVIMVDLDFFKSVNDRYGHPGGDAVLKATAQCLSYSLRITDTLARMGGEEFIVLLPDTGREGAMQVANKLRDAIRAMDVDFEGRPIQVTASFGVSTLAPTVRGTADAIYAAADRALYVAKQTGRDKVEYAAPEASELKHKA
ncbi:diguanylate cyclase AdrA [Comamonadaceae bacterium]